MSTEKYPLPDDCISLWLSADREHLHLMMNGAEGHSNHVVIPVSKCSLERTEGGAIKAAQAGWAVLLDILKERQKATHATIATRARPVQYNVEGMLRRVTRFDAKGQKEVPTVSTLKDLDLD